MIPSAGSWRLSVFLPDPAGGGPIGASADLRVLASTFDLLTSLYRGVSKGDLYRIGTMSVTALQYQITYNVDDAGEVGRIQIRSLPQRAIDLRFSGGGFGQGLVQACEVMVFSTDQMKFRMGLDLLFHVKSFSLTLHYGRPFTPGMLMSDQRSRDVLDGRLVPAAAAFETVERARAAHHAGIGGKPAGDTGVPEHEVGIEIEAWPLSAGVSALAAGLLVLGLSSLAQTILALSGAVLAATALGPIGLAAAAAAAIALAVVLIFVVPPAIQSAVKSKVDEQVRSGAITEQLDAQPLIRYTGEGASEALARKTLERAIETGLEVAAPAAPNDERAGLDRFRGQLFQMVFASDGICRVLIRLDDCHDRLPLPPQPHGPGGDGGSARQDVPAQP